MSTPKRALIYARESKFDARQGNRSPEEQVAEGEVWCQANGYEPIYIDGRAGILEPKTGASRHSRNAKTKRPKWQRATGIIAGLEAGVPQPDALVVWASNRATRKLGEYVELRDLCAEHNVLWVVRGRIYDLTRPDDRLASGMLAVVDDHRTEEMRDDVLRGIRHNASAGRPHGRVLYGHRRIYDTETGALVRTEPDPRTAVIVQRIYREFLAGTAIAHIVDSLMDEGVPSPTGERRWYRPTIRKILERESYVGDRVHQGQVIGSADWPPLIERNDWERVQERLRAQAARQSHQTPGAWLLSSVARCGVCGSRMHGSRSTGPNGTGKKLYLCAGDLKHETGRSRCAGRDQERLDEWVSAALLGKFAKPATADLPTESVDPAVTSARERVQRLTGELEEVMALWKQRDEKGARRLSAQAYADMEAELLPQIAAAEREAQSALMPLSVDIPTDPDSLGTWWTEELSAELRREVAGAFILQVVVYPVGKGRRNYDDADFTEIVWRR